MQKIQCIRLEVIGERHNSLAARFSSQTEADKAKPLAGGYGGKTEPETIIIYDKAHEWKAELDTSARESGLAKLTDAEKKALNLVDEC